MAGIDPLRPRTMLSSVCSMYGSQAQENLTNVVRDCKTKTCCVGHQATGTLSSEMIESACNVTTNEIEDKDDRNQ